jgi:2-keto-4-pentenoate hydratase/2-oxohepta-3-ene-1,7-dioic acid hydratase in catechol pathway
MMFLKAPTSVIGPLDTIVLPDSNKVDYEGELGVVIGKKAKNVKESEALSYLLGCSIVNDVSARDYHQQDKSFARSKGVDTFCPFGPFIVTGLNPDNLKIETRLNGKTVQSSNTSDLLFNVPQLISFASKYMTLLPGDLIATGTPSGIGPMKKGDVVEVEIEGIGLLKNFIS